MLLVQNLNSVTTAKCMHVFFATTVADCIGKSLCFHGCWPVLHIISLSGDRSPVPKNTYLRALLNLFELCVYGTGSGRHSDGKPIVII